MFLKFKLELAKLIIRIELSNAANRRRQIDTRRKDIVMWANKQNSQISYPNVTTVHPSTRRSCAMFIRWLANSVRCTTIRTCLPYKDRNPPQPNRRRDRSRRPWARLRNGDFSDPRWLLPRGSWLASSRKCSCKQDDELKDSLKITTYGQKNFIFQWSP